MSLGPALTCSRSRRDRLSTTRNTFTFASNLLVLFLATLYFQFIPLPLNQFQILSYTCIVLGGTASIIFFCTVNERFLTKGTFFKKYW
jgi:Na+/melibiose symporter-like transporter